MTATVSRTDYDEIRLENRDRYGWDREFWQPLLANVYSRRTHFLLELLQNAEDARDAQGRGASKIRFDLRRDRLEVRHDGRPFSGEDVKAICRVGRGTKGGDEAYIGRFGIGFKSVYAYTERPAIHCPPEHFAIERFVDPVAVEPRTVPDGWTTVFVFPFEHRDVPAEKAYAEIGQALRLLEPRCLLFLRNLCEIEWRDVEGHSGRLSREASTVDGAQVTVVRSDRGGEEAWLRFEAECRHGAESLPVELAFYVEELRGGFRRVVPAPEASIVTYFPTKQSTRCGLLLQASFDLTPNREELRGDSDRNQRLIRAAAARLPEALEEIRDRGWLCAETLEALPLSPRDFPEGHMLCPLMDAARKALRERALVPQHDGPCMPAGRLRYPASQRLRELLSAEQLGELVGNGEPLHWPTSDMSKAQTPKLYECLFGNKPYYSRPDNPTIPPLVPNLEVRSRDVLNAFTPTFLSKQTEGWLVSLYEYLERLEAERDVLRRLPLVRLEDGSHVAAFDEDGMPQVWLPPEGSTTTFPTVKRSIAERRQAQRFLRQVGMTEPDMVDDLIHSTLPRYDRAGSTGWEMPPAEHERHLQRMQRATREARPDKRQRLLEALAQRRIVRARRAATGEVRWCRPSEVHRGDDPGFLEYAKGCNLAILEESETYAELWVYLGVPMSVRVTYAKPGWDGHVSLVSERGRHWRGRHGFDPGFDIEGLEQALQTPSRSKSLFVWNLIRPYAHTLRGEVEKSTRQDWIGSRLEETNSGAGALLRKAAWLPRQGGGFASPAEVAVEELDADFVRDENLALALGMAHAADRERLADTLGIAAEDLSYLLGNQAALTDLVTQLKKQDKREEKRVQAGNGMTAADYLAGRQAVAAEDRYVDAPLPEGGPKTAASLEKAHRASRELKRDDRTEARRTIRTGLSAGAAALNDEARRQLQADYEGRCQICGQTFIRLAGGYACEVVQWQPAIESGGETFVGNLLLLCGWHASLVDGARYTLLGGQEASRDDLRGYIRRASEKDEDDGPCFVLPIYFHQVLVPGEAQTRTKRERIRYSRPHWMAFQMLMLGDER